MSANMPVCLYARGRIQRNTSRLTVFQAVSFSFSAFSFEHFSFERLCWLQGKKDERDCFHEEIFHDRL